MLCVKALTMLNPTGLILNHELFFVITDRMPMDDILRTPPTILNKKPGDRNVPNMNELTTVRNNVTVKAGLNPYCISIINEIILANPKRKPGTGWGSIDSEI